MGAQISLPFQRSDFNLDISGVAGFFGGDVAVSAMATVHVYRGRKWLGWYNTPGSYEIAKRYGQLGRTRWWDGLYPGVNVEPSVLFELDGTSGPKYRALRSGTVMAKTSHLGHLFAQECKDIEECVDWTSKPCRKTSPVEVTIANMHHKPDEEVRPRMAGNQRATITSLLALIPILGSLGSSIACVLFGDDWLCFSMIVLGMVANGLSCFIIGTGTFIFTHPQPAQGAPPGDGILVQDEQIIVLKGDESAINPVTRGRFSLKYKSEPNYHDIAGSSFLLTVQFLAHLLLVPQGTIFGQIMFLTSLAISWLYNSYLSSLDKESIQRRILVNTILQKPDMRKYRLGTRTTMVVFVLLVLASRDTPGRTQVEPRNLRTMLNDLLPNDTEVWRTWKQDVLKTIERYLENPTIDPTFDDCAEDRKLLTNEDLTLLDNLYQDAKTAFDAYDHYLRSPTSRDSPVVESDDGKGSFSEKSSTLNCDVADMV